MVVATANTVLSKTNNVTQYVKPKPEVESHAHITSRARVSGESKTAQMACFKRYDSLYQGDGVILNHPTPTTSYAKCDKVV